MVTRASLTCIALRTNLTVRELAAVTRISKSTVHRIIAAITPQLAACVPCQLPDRRFAWVVDGTLIATPDHRYAAKSKNYRWSCNAQILIRRRDLAVIGSVAGGPGNRNDVVITEAPRSSASARHIAVSWPMAGTAASPSCERLAFARTASCEIVPGGFIVVEEHGSSTPSHASKTGECFEITGVEAIISITRYGLSACCTTYDSRCGTTLSAGR